MTIGGVGKPVPSQLYLMQLAGLVVEGRWKVDEPSESQIRRSREYGYHSLRRLTGEDFGYDVEKWYRFLIVGDYGLTHPYGYGGMRQFLRKAGFSTPFKKDVMQQLNAEQQSKPEP
jgi:hypothetical protein